MQLVNRISKLEERSPKPITECYLVPNLDDETQDDAINRYCQENNIDRASVNSPHTMFIVLVPLTRDS